MSLRSSDATTNSQGDGYNDTWRSDSASSAELPQLDKAAETSYSDDFHSSERSAHDSRSANSSSSSSTATEHADDVSEAAVAYSFHDPVAQRSIRIYAPTVLPSEFADNNDERDSGSPPRATQTDDKRASTSTVSHRAGLPTSNVVSHASYSSRFEASSDSSSATRSSSRSSHSSSPSSSSTTPWGASFGRRRSSGLRGVFVSINELTGATDSEDEDEEEEEEEEQKDSGESALQDQAEALEATARVLLRQLQQRVAQTQAGGDAEASAEPQHRTAMLSLPNVPVDSLTVERLRVDTTRLAARQLVAAAASHEPGACPACCQARERLARADWLKLLAGRARADTVRRRLLDHEPASVISREMLRVASTARLVSDWMRTGRAPEMRGIT